MLTWSHIPRVIVYGSGSCQVILMIDKALASVFISGVFLGRFGFLKKIKRVGSISEHLERREDAARCPSRVSIKTETSTVPQISLSLEIS